MEDNRKKDGILGFDDDGWLIGAAIVIAVIVVIITIIVYAIMFLLGIGALVGGAYAVKNYAASFKENVIDSNYGANNA